MPKSRPSRRALLARIQKWMTQLATVMQETEDELIASFKMVRKMEATVLVEEEQCFSMVQFIDQNEAMLKAVRQFYWAVWMAAECHFNLWEKMNDVADQVWLHKAQLDYLYAMKARMREMCRDHHLKLPKDF